MRAGAVLPAAGMPSLPAARSAPANPDDATPRARVGESSAPAPGVKPAWAAYGSSVRVEAALLYATVPVVGIHAALWVTRD